MTGGTEALSIESAEERAGRPLIAYVGSPLPQRSQTFVYREMLGLRSRGWRVVPVTVRAPETGDPELDALAAEAVHVYAPAGFAALIPGMLSKPGQALRAVRDAFAADIDTPKERLKFLFQAWMGLGAAWRLRKSGIAHVHVHLANVPATVGLYLARGLGCGFSFTGHAADLFFNRSALAFKLANADFVACISHWHQTFYDSILPAPAEERPIVRCSVAVPGVVRPETSDIVAVGRLITKKGFDLLVRAFARLDRPDLRLTIAGGGPEQDTLEKLAEAEGVAGRIHFLGSTPHTECLELIRGAAIFAMPCRTSANGDRDGIPVVLMEAMAAGRPVVAGRLESIAELIEDGQSGFMVPPDNVDALAEAIGRLVDDADARHRMGIAGRARVEEEFSDAINWDRIEAALGRALAKKRAA
jgi:glycosyltransferase involved in cell wall biosynthesis